MGRIASTRADGVVLSGYIPVASAHSQLRDLRAGLGPHVTLIGTEGYLIRTLFRVAGPAALGMYIAYPGADVQPRAPAEEYGL